MSRSLATRGCDSYRVLKMKRGGQKEVGDLEGDISEVSERVCWVTLTQVTVMRLCLCQRGGFSYVL